MRNKVPYILGLDVGPNSIGWAVVDCKHEKGKHKGIYSGYKPVSLRALNSRIFLGMLDAKTQVPKNQKRRDARGARNRRAYYKKRREKLVKILTNAGLLSEDYLQNPEKALNKIDLGYAERKVGKAWSKAWTVTEKAYRSPYAMRNFALDEKLEPEEFGRLLLHLQRRRGYFSNRGAKYVELIRSLNLESPKDSQDDMSKEEKKETGPVLAAIDQLTEKLKGRTLGQFIWQESQDKQIPPHRITLFKFEQSKTRRGEAVTEQLQFRAGREMYEKEFDAIWEKQNSFHRLSKDQAEAIKNAIFHQRPLQTQKSTVGNCTIYPNKKRAAAMRLEFQEFRTLQLVNNLHVDQKPLNKEQRQQLVTLASDPALLNKQGRISWKEIAKTLKVDAKDINYGKGGDDGEGKTGLIGNRTAQAIAHSIGIHTWQKLGKKKQVQLVEDLHTMHNKKALYNRLISHWKFSPYKRSGNPEKGALGLVMNEQLEDGYGKYSLKAINELLPHLRAGLDLYAAVEKIGQSESITKTLKVMEKEFLLKVEDVPNIANPIVQKAMYEIRRVMNSIVKRYGKPAIIRLEMAREMKSSKKHRSEIASRQKENRKKNEEAEKEILEHYKAGDIANFGLEELRRGRVYRVTPRDRSKYKMWKEQDEKCPYCQESIGPRQLFSGEAEIEHILPYTGFRQNYMNTLISCRSCNEEKGKQTPYEAWGHDEGRWHKIEKFSKEKYQGPYRSKLYNILKKEYRPESESDFIERQLNDTRYIAAASKKMLEKYGVPIDVNNGAATSELRKKLGLNAVLPRKPASGVYIKTDETVDTETGEILLYNAKKAEEFEKSRHDHRHHAVDAFVVAMTDRAMLKSMIEVHKQEQDKKHLPHQTTKEDWIKKHRLRLPESWKDSPDLHGLLKKRLNTTVVSHMAKRKVWGALHEETYYGKSHFGRRLNIESMRPNVLKKVQQLAEAEPDNNTDWISGESLRSTLLEWAIETQKLKPTDRILPRWKEKDLRNIVYQTPCVTCRKELTGEFLSKFAKDWKPGIGTWVAEKSIHNSLLQWLKTNNLMDKTAKEITAALSKAPPRVLNKKGKPSTPILNVRVARSMTESYFKMAESYVQPGSNHHLILFHDGQKSSKKEKRVRIVTMLEAAKRASAGKPVIVKEPPSEWREWHYELDLCINDIVRCEDMSIFEDTNKFVPEHAETPYFRVQKISGSGNKRIDLYLRHHSISGTESDWGLWHIQSLGRLKCRKVQLGNLGLLPEA